MFVADSMGLCIFLCDCFESHAKSSGTKSTKSEYNKTAIQGNSRLRALGSLENQRGTPYHCIIMLALFLKVPKSQ